MRIIDHAVHSASRKGAMGWSAAGH
jgi:hypothetical protein